MRSDGQVSQSSKWGPKQVWQELWQFLQFPSVSKYWLSEQIVYEHYGGFREGFAQVLQESIF